MASSSDGSDKMEKISKPPSLVSPLKRLTKKLSGTVSGQNVRKKSATKSSEINIRPLRGSGASRTFGAAGGSPKRAVVRHLMTPKGHESSASKRLLVNSAKCAMLTKRLVLSRLGTVRAGTDNRFHLNKAKLLKRGKSKSGRQTATPEGLTEMSVKKIKDIARGDTSAKKAFVNELKSLFGRNCDTEYEMYQLLDERDKILSKARVRSAHVEDANVIQGTCTDMCPEKERYLRVVQKRISPYECDATGAMMPHITVKDYSRSAADQEEPLPHELRPAEVLRRTMNYLIGKIANEIPEKDEELSVWYDFLWNRTRAIRKDITQQMMVNETAVILNEQCARLHILAAHRLCKLDSNEFDQKMNTENLSKCLQSLRHLYEDLGKRGIYCKSEAEFRAYDIMLNLADSYISRQVLEYRPEIRTSPSVKFALQLFASYQSGNYRRFFKLLLEKADYLQCCICHRYFPIFRERSLSTIVEAFTASGSAFAKFPLRKFTGLLGFDSDDQSREIARFYGFECKLDPDCKEEYVVLSRSEFIQPKERPILMQSWIEQKRNSVSSSMVLSGGVEVVVQSWEPVVSFKDGKYCNDPVINEFISGSSLECDHGVASIAESKGQETSVAKFYLPTEGEFLLNIAVDELTEVEVFDIVVRTFSAAVVDAATEELFEAVYEASIKNVFDAFIKKSEFRRRAISVRHLIEKKKKEIAVISDSLLTDFLDKTVPIFLQSVCKRVFDETAIRQKALDNLATEFYTDLLTESIKSVVRMVCRSLFTESAQITTKCSEIRSRLNRLWLKQFFDQWRIHVLKKKKRFEKVQRVLREFPVVLPVKSSLTVRHPMSLAKNCAPWASCYKEKLEGERQKRTEELARSVFLYWHRWTQRRVLRTGFFRDFFGNSLESTRKRHYPLKNEGDLALRRRLLLNEERMGMNDIGADSSHKERGVNPKDLSAVEEDVRVALCDIDAISTPQKKRPRSIGRSDCILSPVKKLLPVNEVVYNKDAAAAAPLPCGWVPPKNESLTSEEQKRSLATLRKRLLDFEKDVESALSAFNVDVLERRVNDGG